MISKEAMCAPQVLNKVGIVIASCPWFSCKSVSLEIPSKKIDYNQRVSSIARNSAGLTRPSTDDRFVVPTSSKGTHLFAYSKERTGVKEVVNSAVLPSQENGAIERAGTQRCW